MLIVGAGGFAKEVIEAILDNYPEESLVFYDDVNKHDSDFFLNKYPILTSKEQAKDHLLNKDKRFVVGIGKPSLRLKLTSALIEMGGEPHTVVSTRANVGKFENSIGKGTSVLQQAIIENGNTIGDGVLVHVGTLVSHDVVVGDYTELSPYVKLLGKVKVGKLVSIGTGAIILPGIHIEDNAIIGAGSVVTKNVKAGETVVGVPAKPLKK